jgi:hypothetical protein
LIKESFIVNEGNLPIILTSISSGLWVPDFIDREGINVTIDTNKYHDFVKKMQKKLKREIKQKFNQEFNPYTFFVNLSTNIVDIYNKTINQSQTKEKKTKLNNVLIQFWEMLDWILKQSFRGKFVLWFDFGENNSSLEKYHDVEIYHINSNLESNSNIPTDFFNNFCSSIEFKNKIISVYPCNNIKTIRTNFKNKFITELLDKNIFVTYFKFNFKKGIIDSNRNNDFLIDGLINSIIHFLAKGNIF